ncbi:MAG: glycosyltransferase [Anaerolineales bacterium]|nr:glycosyltransferase [Anaerolineales bacterium]
MRTAYFLFPKLNIHAGGHLAQMKLLSNTAAICKAQAVTYEDKAEGTPTLDEVLQASAGEDAIFFVHWGPHVPGLIERLKGRHVVYVSYSTGYGFHIPANVPILAGSRHTQAYWGRYAANNPIYYVSCEIADEFTNKHRTRDVDVLVQKRKSSRYLLEELVPALQVHCNVMVLDSWVESLSDVLNNSKVYLYDSTEYWGFHDVSEGFGLPPLEALACGCTVFSSVNDALSDYLDPGLNAHKLRGYSKEYDVARILKAVREWKDDQNFVDPAADYRKDAVQKRLRIILKELNDFFDYKHDNAIADLGILPHEVEVKRLNEELYSIKSSRAWKFLERLRRLRAKFTKS